MNMVPAAPHPFSVLKPALEVYLLGLVDFEAALFLQDRLATGLGERADAAGAVLVCEHPPLITVGREGSRADFCCSPEELTSREIAVRWLNRGGGCVSHAPGQLAIYPIIPLERRHLGLVDFRNHLEAAVVDACVELQIPASQRPDEPGVWCRAGQVAQIGIAVRNGVSYHGAFVNVCPRPDLMRLTRGLAGARLSSLAAQGLRPVSMAPVRESLVRNLAARLDYPRYHLYTGHPLLRRTKKVVAYA